MTLRVLCIYLAITPQDKMQSSSWRHVTHVLLDMLKVRRLLEPFHVVEDVFQPIIQNRVVVPYSPKVCFEVLSIHRIEPYNCREHSQVQFSERFSEDERPAILRNQCFQLVQRGEERNDASFVVSLRSRETSAVNTKIDQALNPWGDLINLGAQRRRIQIDSGNLWLEQ